MTQSEILNALIAKRKKEIFIPEYQDKATNAECLGIIISQYCQWSSEIFEVFLAALEDANFHKEAAKVQEMYDKIQSRRKQ